MRRAIEALLFALLVPLPLMIEFGDYVDVGYGELILSRTPLVIAIAFAAALIAWCIGALVARFVPPRGKSAAGAFAVRFGVAWLVLIGIAVAAWANEEFRALHVLLWPAGKMTLGVLTALIAASLAGAHRER